MEQENIKTMKSKTSLILREACNLVVPAVLLYAFYVQFHGDYGPGGGFQAGVIFAAGIILYAMVHGRVKAQKIFPTSVVRYFISFGLLLYAGVGVASLFMGGNYLDYNVLAHDPLHGQHLGIFLIELGVGITVAAVMIMIFYMLDEYAE